jgi:hypothetical protein
MNKIDLLAQRCQQVQQRHLQELIDEHKDDDILGLLELAVTYGYPGIVWFEFPQNMMGALDVFSWADKLIKAKGLQGTGIRSQCLATWYPVLFRPRGQCLEEPENKMVPIGISLPQSNIDDQQLYQDHGGPLNPNNDCCGRCHMVYFLSLNERKRIIDNIEKKMHHVFIPEIANLALSYLDWRTGLSD